MYTVKELQKYKKAQLIALARYDGKEIPKKVTKDQLIDILVQPELPFAPVGNIQPCSVRVQRIKDSVKE